MNTYLYTICRVILVFAICYAAAVAQTTAPHVIQSYGNPILSDGSYYSADPAPLVAYDRLYILAGRDEAGAGVNDFVINEWQMFVTRDVGSGRWVHYPDFLRPEAVFSWASPGHAYAGQIVQGRDKRFYLYAPVQEAHTLNEDKFAIGVAVADTPLGPWKDAHPTGPIISQSLPSPNQIQNIDPTVWVDDDGRIYLYWGTFGQLMGIELASDMVTASGPEVHVNSLTGFFEAAWLFKRKDTYYMVYAGNQAGPNSACTPAIYHACIAYGTAPTALGPWTYRGVILDPVTSTTSHPGVIQFQKRWYLVYHTADAKGGGHFRRSIALDQMHWDDTISPARILKVQATRSPSPLQPLTRNAAYVAHPSASNEPVPVQYWINALNDGTVRANPLPPDMWASWTPHNPATQWIQYTWSSPVTLNESQIQFWADNPEGSGEGVAPPAAWHLEYWVSGGWHAVEVQRPNSGNDLYPVSITSFNRIRFRSITTRCLRAVFEASGSNEHHAAVAVQEWEALAPRPLRSSNLPALADSTATCKGN